MQEPGLTLRDRRRVMVYAVATVTVVATLSGAAAVLWPFLVRNVGLAWTIGFAALIVSVLTAIGIAVYLRESVTSLKFSPSDRLSDYHMRRGFEVLETRINEIKQHVGPQMTTTDEDRERFANSIQEAIASGLSETFLKSIESRYASEILEQAQTNQLVGRFEATKHRLTTEIAALTRRGNVNLIIGIITAMVGLALLGYFVVEFGQQARGTSPSDSEVVPPVDLALIPPLLGLFLPRLSLIIVIEMFAYFFLKLYRKSLDEIKYFQNEMTNIEAKYIALEGALFLEDKEPLRQIVEQLSKTERNFVLSKGETTVEIEKLKLEGHGMAEALSTITTLAEQVKKNP